MKLGYVFCIVGVALVMFTGSAIESLNIGDSMMLIVVGSMFFGLGAKMWRGGDSE